MSKTIRSKEAYRINGISLLKEKENELAPWQDRGPTKYFVNGYEVDFWEIEKPENRVTIKLRSDQKPEAFNPDTLYCDGLLSQGNMIFPE